MNIIKLITFDMVHEKAKSIRETKTTISTYRYYQKAFRILIDEVGFDLNKSLLWTLKRSKKQSGLGSWVLLGGISK